jgi:hypothetical protein
MKARGVLLMSAVLLLSGQFATIAQDKYLPKPDEVLYGTWANEKMFPPKWIMKPDGSYEQYNPVSNTVPFERGRFEIWKKWTDSNGTVWYYVACTVTSGVRPGFMFQATWKIRQSGNVAEWVRRHVARFDESYFMSTVNPKDLAYRLYHRSEN